MTSMFPPASDGASDGARERAAGGDGPRAPLLSRLAALALSLMASCTFLVRFEEHEPSEDEDAGGEPDARAPLVPTPVADATAPSNDAPATTACGPGQPNALLTGGQICCNGTTQRIDDPKHCGGCGIVCASGQTCSKQANERFYCSTCAATGGCPSCWSGCCSASFGPAGVCAANDCDTGDCIPQACTARSMVCVPRTAAAAAYCRFPNEP